MSMTKRYLESLPKEQQDDILGLGPQDDEWTESADNAREVWDVCEGCEMTFPQSALFMGLCFTCRELESGEFFGFSEKGDDQC